MCSGVARKVWILKRKDWVLVSTFRRFDLGLEKINVGG